MEEQGRVFIEKAIEQPLDPQRLAQGVRNEEEAPNSTSWLRRH